MNIPSNIPNLNQILFKGDRTDEFKRAKIKKVIAIIADQILILPSWNNGIKDMIVKKTKKTIPKFLFDEIFKLFEFNYLFLNCLKNFMLSKLIDIKFYYHIRFSEKNSIIKIIIQIAI